MSLKYRPEIDGLRALAVGAVVLYHAELAFGEGVILQGGYIGVDIFFVISGYLITSIILRELARGSFSFAGFYERRARRILPALFTVILASIPFAWIYMLPAAMKEYSGSILSALAFGSNYWFLHEDSYWAAPSALKPFLHTWSLSVEEQFYVIYPILLMLLWRKAPGRILSVFFVSGVFLLLLAHMKSAVDPDTAFYLLPTRGWELLGGAFLAKLEQDRGRFANQHLQRSMPALGLLMVCASIALFDAQTQHPSLITALPVLGTMLLIWFCKRGEPVSDVLASRPLVALGLLSYSFYLWHFPVLAFARIREPALANLDKSALILAALGFSALTYFFIERPARNRVALGSRAFAGSIVVVFVALTGVQAGFFGSDGVPGRLGLQREYYESFTRADYETVCHGEPGDASTASGICKIGAADKDPEFLVVGDSHALSLLSLFNALGIEEEVSGGFITEAACPPLVNVYRKGRGGNDDACPGANRRALEFARSQSIKNVFLVARWNYYLAAYDRVDIANVANPGSWSIEKNHEVLAAQFINTISEYRRLGVVPIILSQVPHQNANPMQYFHEAFRTASHKELPDALYRVVQTRSITFAEHLANNRSSDAIINEANAGGIAAVVDTGSILCGEICAFGNENYSFYFDDDHLSVRGAERLKTVLAAYF